MCMADFTRLQRIVAGTIEIFSDVLSTSKPETGLRIRKYAKFFIISAYQCHITHGNTWKHLGNAGGHYAGYALKHM
jgi:hypothetical protein